MTDLAELSIDDLFPAGRQAILGPEIIEDDGPLDVSCLEAAQAHASAAKYDTVPSIKRIRETHHRLAQMLASGMDHVTAAQLTGYTPTRIHQLQADPAFQELLTHYATNIATETADDTVAFIKRATGLSSDILAEIQSRLDENPEAFTITTLIDTLKAVADRAGLAPVNKTVSKVDVNVNLGDRLKLARERANAAIIEGQARVIEP